jgi:hypothetical protein
MRHPDPSSFRRATATRSPAVTVALALALVSIPAPRTLLAQGANAANPKASNATANTANISFHNIAGLTWMAGAWTRADADATTEEHWMAPAGNAMLGMGRSVRGGKMVEFEFMRIEVRGDGIFYVASPNGGDSVAFRMMEMGANRVMFYNPEHDFPKRIVYWLDEDGALHARIEGETPETGREWMWQRLPAKP